jgi:hypothetical protein
MKRVRLLAVIVAAVLAAGAIVNVVVERVRLSEARGAVEVSGRLAISPDYTDIVIPPNIAPMNFRIENEADGYFVRIRSDSGKAIEILSDDPEITIDAGKWRRLLEGNRGKNLHLDISVKTDGVWKKYETITNRIAADDIDGYLVYRLIKPLHNLWSDVGIYQRNLESFKQSPVLRGNSYKNGCVNCHTFLNNDPSNMFVGIRSADYGSSTLHVGAGAAEKIGTKWGYTSWHPSGKLAAFSVNKVRQFFHTTGMEVRDVVDLDAVLMYYDVSSHEVKTADGLADKERLESYPTWSPDGKWLYFCSAPILWEDRETVPPKGYRNVKYDLRRISYDIETDTWGDPETVLSADETHKSILQPRITPDGKRLVFCMCDYGCFPIYQPSSDLYVMDLNSGEYRKLPINSKFSESWHSFSSNSRWMVFSSKRQGGMFTRTYISHVDSEGVFGKAFVLPQKDPAFYESFLKTFSVPELITGPVKVSPGVLGRAVRSEEHIDVDLPITGASPKAGAQDAQYQERE